MTIRAQGHFLSTIAFVLLAMRFAVPAVYGDVSDVGPCTTLLMSTPVLILSVLGIITGGLAMIFDPFGAQPQKIRQTLPPARGQAPALNSEAQVATAQIDKLVARFHDLPEDAVPMDVRIECDAIVDKHLPGLRSAHHDARSTVAAGSDDAEVLDHDFAQSLNRLSATLIRLLDNCGENARGRFEVEQRFIEMRHPDEGLSV
ncbi:hypothetical protein [Sphingomonas sp. TZW2008]|uniref:hypothetical protein n=1 Tax=Sphingomonas sp. TZW2008 TaxID=1917973 RepID=UPI000A272140|nr:hypothetical protein [Sphingomonas sp. TZW2008]